MVFLSLQTPQLSEIECIDKKTVENVSICTKELRSLPYQAHTNGK